MTRILVVEDEVIIARELQSRLQELDYDVPDIAVSGEEAIEKAERLQPDLVLMDIHLKGAMDGIGAAEALQVERAVPVVYLTAYADDETVRRARLTGPFGYLLKPFQTKELQTTIEMALYKHEMEMKLRRAHAQLQHYVKELEARDRLIQFQMSGPNLQAAYDEILQVVEWVLAVSRAAIYWPVDKELQVVATLGFSSSGPGEESVLVERAYLRAQPQCNDAGDEAAVPMLYREKVIGVIWANGLLGRIEVGEDALNALWRLGQQAALLLRMARVTEDVGAGKIEIEDLLELAEE